MLHEMNGLAWEHQRDDSLFTHKYYQRLKFYIKQYTINVYTQIEAKNITNKNKNMLLHSLLQILKI